MNFMLLQVSGVALSIFFFSGCVTAGPKVTGSLPSHAPFAIGPAVIPPEAQRYSDAIDAVLENKMLQQNLEEVYELGQAAARKVGGVVQRLADGDYNRLQGLMKGFNVLRSEYAAVATSPAYFLKIAQEKGRPQDREFFKNFDATRPDGLRAEYFEQITDFASCVRFGSGKLVELFGYWKGYQLKFRKSYVREVAQELDEIRDVLWKKTCACGDKTAVLKELQEFVDRYSGDPFIEKVRVRLQEAKSDKAGFQYNCHPS